MLDLLVDFDIENKKISLISVAVRGAPAGEMRQRAAIMPGSWRATRMATSPPRGLLTRGFLGVN